MRVPLTVIAISLFPIVAMAQISGGVPTGPVSNSTVTTTGSTTARTLADIGTDMTEANDYGCAAVVNNASLDATPCIQRTLNAAATQQRVAHMVGGVYYIMSPITWPTFGVDVVGDGWNQQYTHLGTWLHVVSANFMVGGTYAGMPPISLGSSSVNGSVIKDIAFTEDQPVDVGGWAPNDYGPMIQVIGARQVRFEHLYAAGVNKFIDLQGVGGFYLEDILGQYHTYAFNIESNSDYMHAHRIHVNDFWCSVSSCPNVAAYDQSNAVVFQSNRNDNPTFDDVSAFGVFNLFNFGNQTTGSLTGITAQAKMSNLDCDKCFVTIEVAGNGTSGQISNLHAHANNFAGNAALLGSRLLSIDSNSNHFDISNISTDVTGDSSVYVGGSGNQLTMTGVNLATWGSNAVAGAACNTINAINVADTTAAVQVYNVTYTPGCSTLTATVANGTSAYSAVLAGGGLTFEFGNATTGIGQTTQYSYNIIGHTLFGEVSVVLNNVGSATGAASIHGLAFPPNNNGTWGSAAGGTCNVATNMASLTSTIIAQIAANGTTIALLQYGTTGTTNLTNSNFTNTSVIRCTFTYLL